MLYYESKHKSQVFTIIKVDTHTSKLTLSEMLYNFFSFGLPTLESPGELVKLQVAGPHLHS